MCSVCLRMAQPRGSQYTLALSEPSLCPRLALVLDVSVTTLKFDHFVLIHPSSSIENTTFYYLKTIWNHQISKTWNDEIINLLKNESTSIISLTTSFQAYWKSYSFWFSANLWMRCPHPSSFEKSPFTWIFKFSLSVSRFNLHSLWQVLISTILKCSLPLTCIPLRSP